METEIGIEMANGTAGDREGLQLDFAWIIGRLRRTFPGIEIEDQYFRPQSERGRQIIASHAAARESGRGAFDAAPPDAEDPEPGFRLWVWCSSGWPLTGSFNRYRLTFRFESNIDPELKAKAEEFLADFALNRVECDLDEPDTDAVG